MKRSLAFSIALACALFLPLFASGGIGAFDFWWWMAANAVLLTLCAFLLDTGYGRRIRNDFAAAVPAKILLGVLSAAVLYVVFWAGNELSALLFSWAPSSIAAVYDFKRGASLLRVVLTIGLLIGPGEEIFWRGFLQEGLRARMGKKGAVACATLCYTLVHFTSANPMLLVAAAVCGTFWGILYEWKRSVLLNIVSHVLWDLTVFVLLPFH